MVTAIHGDANAHALRNNMMFRFDPFSFPGTETLSGNNREYARDLLNLRSDLTVDVLQRDRVDPCQLYLIEGY